MGSIVAILSSSAEENRILSERFGALEEVRCIAFEDEGSLLEWVFEGLTPVDVLILDHPSASLLASLKQLPATANACFILLSQPDETHWVEGVLALNELVDNVFVRPFAAGTLRERVQLLSYGAKQPAALLVNESETDHDEIIKALSAAGIGTFYEVRDVSAGMQALGEREGRITVVVGVWEMPGQTSLVLLREMRAQARYARIPFLMVTSAAALSQITAVQSYEASFDAKLLRPISAPALSAQLISLWGRIDRHLEANRFLREASMFVHRGLLIHAESILEHALRVLPDERRVIEALADVTAKQGRDLGDLSRLERAAALYEASLRKTRWRSETVEKAYELYVELGRGDDILKLTKRYLSFSGFDDKLRTWMAKVYLRQGDLGAAKVELRRAVTFNPDNPEALGLLAQIGEKESSCRA